jgi:hypothetical protein
MERKTRIEKKLLKNNQRTKYCGIPYWSNIIPSDNEVLISKIIDNQTLHVCPKNKYDIYKDLFQGLRQKLAALKKNPKVGDLVLATNEKGSTFRAQISKFLTPILIDSSMNVLPFQKYFLLVILEH